MVLHHAPRKIAAPRSSNTHANFSGRGGSVFAMLKAMPKAKGGRTSKKTINSAVNSFTPKLEAAKELGFTPMQVSRFQTLAENKDFAILPNFA